MLTVWVRRVSPLVCGAACLAAVWAAVPALPSPARVSAAECAECAGEVSGSAAAEGGAGCVECGVSASGQAFVRAPGAIRPASLSLSCEAEVSADEREGAPEEGHAPKEEGAAGGASPAGAERAENGSSPRGRGTANGGSAFGSVTGRARIEAEADSVQLYVSVEAAGGDMAEALRRSEQLASAAKEAFAPYGSAAETDVCAFPAPGTGYTAVRSLCLTAERAAEVEAAREALAGAGVTHFGGVSYRSKDEAALRRQALQQAAEDARAKAEALGLDADTLCLREVYCTVYGGPGGVVAEAEVRAFPAAAREARA